MSQYLIDTNILSEPLRPEPNPNVIATIQLNFAEIAIASVTWHEILFGCYRLPPSKKRSRIEEYLKTLVLPSFPILDYNAQAADWHALERKRLAAIANINNLIVVTNNISDFANFENLKLENWFEK